MSMFKSSRSLLAKQNMVGSSSISRIFPLVGWPPTTIEKLTSKSLTPRRNVRRIGAGSLFGFAHVSGVIIDLEESIRGRLLVFFPGEYERNVYRFMDARDGFNYMAVPITCSEGLQI